ncbi:phosphonate ABC transporter substrate-binding protein, partial [Acinetobacter baumannii]
MKLANCINFTNTGNIMKKYMTGAVRLSAMVAGMMMAWQ